MARPIKGMHQFVTSHNITDTKCPICGKTFIPAPYHAYKTREATPRLVCSYSCDMKAFENYNADLDKKKERDRARYRAKHPLHIESITPEKWAICTECGFVKEVYYSLEAAQHALDQYNNNKK